MRRGFAPELRGCGGSPPRLPGARSAPRGRLPIPRASRRTPDKHGDLSPQPGCEFVCKAAALWMRRGVHPNSVAVVAALRGCPARGARRGVIANAAACSARPTGTEACHHSQGVSLCARQRRSGCGGALHSNSVAVVAALRGCRRAQRARVPFRARVRRTPDRHGGLSPQRGCELVRKAAALWMRRGVHPNSVAVVASPPWSPRRAERAAG